MPKYKYEIQKSKDKVVTGVIEAESLMAASNWARNQEGFLLNIEPAGSSGGFMDQLRNIRVEGGPGLKDILYFTKQLTVMIRAGISIRDAIEGIAEQVENMRFKSILNQCKSDVESGLQFSEALAKHEKVFSPLYINMIKASELSGTFARMLERVGLYLEEQAETRSMVRGAMIYPAVLFTMSVSAVVFLLTWVLPKFMGVFKGKEDLLPKPTKMLLAMSDFLRNDWYYLVGIALLLVVGFIYSQKTPTGRLYFDKFKLKVPIMSKMFRAIYIAQSLQTMGELVVAGVPMLEVLEITGDVAGNQMYKDMWLKVRDSVQEGNKIVQPLYNSTLLPKSVVQMISAGEESGRLGEVLSDISVFYARELRDTIKAVTGLIEPIMIVFMGFVVGFIAMSIILPIFQMSRMN